MIDLKQIMQDLPVQNFIPQNFKRIPYGYKYKIPSVQCVIEQSLVKLFWNDSGILLYISLTERAPHICYWASDIKDDWHIDMKSTYSKSDLFNKQIMLDLFGMDLEFVEYCRKVYLKVLKEFYHWKYENPFEK